MKHSSKRVLCIAWAPSSPRFDEIAIELGASRVNMTVLYGPAFLAPLRYAVLFFWTLLLLVARDPDVVYAQNPAIFCPLTCLIYCKIRGKELVVDHHCVWSVKTFSGGTLGKLIFLLERFVDVSAASNTAPHEQWGRMLVSMGARNVNVLYDYVERKSLKSKRRILDRFAIGTLVTVLAPHGGHPLERVENEVRAVSGLPSVSMLLTGPPEKLGSRISRIRPLPANVRYLGLLPMHEYDELKASVDVGLSVTDEPYTLSHSLLEFAASSVPIVSTKQDAVEELFGDSVCYVKSSSVEDVRAVLRSLSSDSTALVTYRERIIRRFEQMTAERAKAVERLKNIVLGREIS